MSAWRIRGVLTLFWPVEYGVIGGRLDDWEKVLHSLFYNGLRAAPEEIPVVCVLSPQQLADNGTESVVQIMFETFSIPVFLPLPSDVAALYALSTKERRNCMTGMVVSLGATIVVSCVDDGVSVPPTVVVRQWGGWEISDQLRKKEGLSHDLAFEVLEKLCFVAPYPLKHFDSDVSAHPELVARCVPDCDVVLERQVGLSTIGLVSASLDRCECGSEEGGGAGGRSVCVYVVCCVWRREGRGRKRRSRPLLERAPHLAGATLGLASGAKW